MYCVTRLLGSPQKNSLQCRLRECLSQLKIQQTKETDFVRSLTALSSGIHKLKTTLVSAVEKSFDTGVAAITETVEKLDQLKPPNPSPTVHDSQHTLQLRIDGIEEYTENSISDHLESEKWAAALM